MIWFLISFLSKPSLLAFLCFFPSYWVSLLCFHCLSLGWDNPPCRGLQSAGRLGKSLNYPFALKLKPNHNSLGSVQCRIPTSLGLIVGLDFFFRPLLCCAIGKMKLNQNKSENVKMLKQVMRELMTLFQGADFPPVLPSLEDRKVDARIHYLRGRAAIM